MCSSVYEATMKTFDASQIEAQNRFFAEQKSLLTSGGQNGVYFYSTFNTDELVAQFAGMPEIEYLVFELTDISNAGFQHVADLPNLKKLVLYGGRTHHGLELLRGHQSLEKLELINIDVTDRGLAVLKTLPRLVELYVYRNSSRQKFLSDAAKEQLRELSGLRKLTISGGWMSESAVDELKTDLPNCEIKTETSY